MLGHVEVDDAPAVVSEHDKNKEDAQARGWLARNVRQV